MFSEECPADTGNRIRDPVGEIYTDNIPAQVSVTMRVLPV